MIEFLLQQLCDEDAPLIGFITLQRNDDGNIIAVQHKVKRHEPRPEEFVTSLRWMAEAIEIEGLPE
ncbi:hypothetical protein SAMN05428970_2005 [Agromyces sp. CF514]|uniref:hypothetical protein n=1 Tax=Agromyces sp. CF514 TaxID=1881031 RepID=UPI0008E9C26D|nr:hypothetical protein [Agromyces sp. CF514]SFR76024.1 hypothetical protein SAMN05428970_2005 [Agromyces sp. CF514]